MTPASRPLLTLALIVGLASSVPANAATAQPTNSGTWAYAKASYGPDYVAIPEGRGWQVTVCGPLDCIDVVSTDAGPALYLQRAGRIGDLAAVMFQEICGPLSAGLCRGSYTITGPADQHPEDPPEHPADRRMRAEDNGEPRMTLPPTDTAEGSIE